LPKGHEAVLADIDAEYARVADQRSLRRDPVSTYINRLEDIVDPYIDTILIKLNGKNAPDLIELIRKRRTALFLSSGMKPEILGICKQVLSFGVAGLALSLGFADRFRYLPPAVQRAIIIGGIFYIDMLIVSLLVLIVYTLQARFRYPFLYFDRIGNTWAAFYYGSISSDVPRRAIQFRRDRLKGATRYAQDFLRFADKVVQETERETLRAELQQYFLLLAYSGYAHQFSLRLGNWFVYGIGWSVCTSCVLVGMAVLR
jgi:hypothetical protein